MGRQFISVQELRSKPIDLSVGDVLVEPDVPTDRVVFLEGGLGSIVATAPDGEKIEVGLRFPRSSMQSGGRRACGSSLPEAVLEGAVP